MTSTMPDGLMTVKAEVFALGVDDAGVWLINGARPDGTWGSWLSDPLAAYGDMHAEVLDVLSGNRIEKADLLLAHSTSASEPGAWTSWHPDDTSVVHTYMVPVSVPLGMYVRELWQAARPVTLKLFELCGRPEAYRPVDAPVPRDVDILFHGLRHLKHLVMTDTDHADALGDGWIAALRLFTPVLATMYHRKPQPVA